jgi:glycosyltransferase involved in cell wall biosynthesis
MFAPAFPPFGNPEAIANGNLALTFLQAGFELDVISRRLYEESPYTYGSEWDQHWLPLKGAVQEVQYDRTRFSVRVLDFLTATWTLKHPIEGCRWAKHAYQLALGLHAQHQYDLVLSRSGPDSAHLAALAFSRGRALPWLANWNDPSGVKHPPPYGRGKNADLGFWHERFLGEVARAATWHTFPSAMMRDYICEYLGASAASKSTVIPHAAPVYRTPEPTDRKGPFTVTHAGRLSAERSPVVLIEGFSAFVREERPAMGARLLIVGIDDHGAKDLAGHHGVGDHVIFLSPRSYSETLSLLCTSEVLLIVEAYCKEGIYLPVKFVDYVSTGRPILALTSPESTLYKLLASQGGGIAADASSPADVARCLTTLYRQWERGALGGTYGSSCLFHLFSPEKIVSEYCSLFGKIAMGYGRSPH